MGSGCGWRSEVVQREGVQLELRVAAGGGGDGRQVGK